MARYMKSKFTPREFPQAIMLRDEVTVLGPFCVHCGAPRDEHSVRGLCPNRVSSLYPPPACKCHGVKTTEPRRIQRG